MGSDQVTLEQRGSLERVIADFPSLTVRQKEELAKIRVELKKDFGTFSIEDVLLGDKNYALSTIIIDLLPRLEAARKTQINFNVEPDYEGIIKGQIQYLKSSCKTEFEEVDKSERYWKTLQEVLCGDFVEAYRNIATRKNKIESSFLYKYGFGNKYFITLLTALPGLITLRMPYSTPFIMAAGGAIGNKLVYPYFQKVHSEDLTHLGEMIINRQKDIMESVTKSRNEESFTLPGILRNLIPKLEIARIAGKGYENYEAIVTEHLTELRKEVRKNEMVSEDEWKGIELMVQDEFLPSFGNYAAEQSKIERRGMGYRFLLKKSVTTILTMGILCPIYFRVGRTIPLGVIDDILMAGLFGTIGYNIPNWLHPHHKPLNQIYSDYKQSKKLYLPIDKTDKMEE